MMRPLQQALRADKHRTASCFSNTDLAGEVTVEFSWHVESTAKHATATSLRLSQIHDGVALADPVLTCLERELDGTYEALADAQPFPEFAGDVPVRLSWGPAAQPTPPGRPADHHGQPPF